VETLDTWVLTQLDIVKSNAQLVNMVTKLKENVEIAIVVVLCASTTVMETTPNVTSIANNVNIQNILIITTTVSDNAQKDTITLIIHTEPVNSVNIHVKPVPTHLSVPDVLTNTWWSKMVLVTMTVHMDGPKIPKPWPVSDVTILAEPVTDLLKKNVPLVNHQDTYLTTNVSMTVQNTNMKTTPVTVIQITIADVAKTVTTIVKLVKIELNTIVLIVLKVSSDNQKT
jgi:hypothetical protein